MAENPVIFASPFCLWLLPLLVAGGFLLWRSARKRAGGRMVRFVAPPFVEQVLATIRWSRVRLRFWLAASVLALLLVVIARPLLGPRPGTAEKKGVDIVIALDVSRSMYVEDVSPNRLAAIKTALSQWFDELNGDRIGLVLFAGEATVQAPLTSDYAALRQILNAANHRAISLGGTNIPRAIEVASKMLEKRREGMKTIVLITDGENFQADAITAARTAGTDQGISIFAVGVGSPDGGKVPESDYSLPEKQGAERRYIPSRMGGDAHSRLDERSLQAVVRAGGGAFYRFDPKLHTFRLLREQALLPLAREGRSVTISDYQELFQIPLTLAVLLLLMEPLVRTDRKRPATAETVRNHPSQRPTRPTRTVMVIGGMLLLSPPARAEPPPLRERVEALLENGKGEEAVALMQSAAAGRERDHYQSYNYALVLYRAGKYSEAIRAFQLVESLSADPRLKARAAKQVGNASFRLAEELKQNPNYLDQAAVMLEQSLAQYGKAAPGSSKRELAVNRQAAGEMLEAVLLAMAERRMRNAKAFSADRKDLSRKEQQLKDAVQIYERLAELRPEQSALRETLREVRQELADTQLALARAIAGDADEMAERKTKMSHVLGRRREALEKYDAALANDVRDRPGIEAEKRELLKKMSDQWVASARERIEPVLAKEEIGGGDVKRLMEARQSIEKAQALVPESPEARELATRVSAKLEEFFEKQGDKGLANAEKQTAADRKLEQTQNAADHFQKALAENPENRRVQEKLRAIDEKLPAMLAQVADESVAKARELARDPENPAGLREAAGHLEKATQSYDRALSLKPEETELEKRREEATGLLEELRREIQKSGAGLPVASNPEPGRQAEDDGQPVHAPTFRDTSALRKKADGRVKTDPTIWERSFNDW